MSFKCTLSGGNFGGEEHEFPNDQDGASIILPVSDSIGHTYELRTHTHEAEDGVRHAVFIGPVRLPKGT